MASWFNKGKAIKYQILEVEKPAPRLSREDSINIASLAEHPGFHALLNKLRIQKAILETALRTKQHTSLQEVGSLQAGINWINWLDKQVLQSAGRQEESKPRDAFELEVKELERMAAALDIIGRE